MTLNDLLRKKLRSACMRAGIKSLYHEPVFLFITQMTQKYFIDHTVHELLNKMDFIILPVLNVDGYSYTWINPVQLLYFKLIFIKVNF